MYSMVLMMSIAGTGDVASFGGRGGCHGSSCSGAVVVAYSGCSGSSCSGHGHAFLGGRRHSCSGSSCSGYTVAAPACCAPAPVATCGCSGGHGFLGSRRASHGCCGATAAPACCSAPVASCCGSAAVAPCSMGTAVVMPAGTPPAAMVKPNTESPPAKKPN